MRKILLSHYDRLDFILFFFFSVKAALVALFICVLVLPAHDLMRNYSPDKTLPEAVAPVGHENLFLFESPAINAADFITENNLKFDADLNLSGQNVKD